MASPTTAAEWALKCATLGHHPGLIPDGDYLCPDCADAYVRQQVEAAQRADADLLDDLARDIKEDGTREQRALMKGAIAAYKSGATAIRGAMTKEEFRQALESYCAFLGGSVTSYGRTLVHNTHVGGVPYSSHQFWLGADVTYDFKSYTLEHRKEVATRLGLFLWPESDHDHLQPLNWKAG